MHWIAVAGDTDALKVQEENSVMFFVKETSVHINSCKEMLTTLYPTVLCVICHHVIDCDSC